MINYQSSTQRPGWSFLIVWIYALIQKRHGSLGGSREAIAIVPTSLATIATVDRNGPTHTHISSWFGPYPTQTLLVGVWPSQDKPRGISNAPTRHHVWHLAAARWELYYQPFEAAIDVGAGAVPFRNSGGKHAACCIKLRKTTNATNMGQHGTTIFPKWNKIPFYQSLAVMERYLHDSGLVGIWPSTVTELAPFVVTRSIREVLVHDKYMSGLCEAISCPIMDCKL